MIESNIVFEDVPINNVKEYWNKRPCNIRHSKSEIGSKQYFDEVEWRKYFVEPHIPAFAEFKKWKGKKVLEIGCGIGTDTINFAREGAKVTAVDLSEESIALAKKRAEVYGLEEQIKFYNSNAEELSGVVPVEKYDLIYSFGVIHHTPNPSRVIEEIKKYMNKDSVLKLMMYNRNSWKVFRILLTYGKFAFWNIDKLIAKYSEAQTGCPVTYSYSKKTIKDLLKGFSVTNSEYEHIFPYKISEYVKYNYVKVWYLNWMPQKLFHWLEKKLGWHLCVDARLES